MSILEHVDASTNLAKNNEVQLLVFKVDESVESPFYAINVFKTREVVEAKRHKLTLIPSAHPLLEVTIVLRGTQIPILNLPSWLGHHFSKEDNTRSNFLICDFNGIIIGLRIMFAFRVVKKNWAQMHAPQSYSSGDNSMIINDTRLEDGSLCLVLDYEKLLSDVIPQAMVDTGASPDNIKDLVLPEKLLKGTVLIAEDSKTAQTHLSIVFQNSKIDYKIFDNGKELVEYIFSLADPKSIPAVVTDIEMPEMSGFTVIQKLREHKETAHLPIIVNSSMTGDNNKREAEGLGADGFVNKTKSKDIIPLIVEIMQAKNYM